MSVVATRGDFEQALDLARVGRVAEAQPLFRRAAEAGSTAAMMALADLGLRGGGVPRDPATGIAWLERAAAAGVAAAARTLAAVHASGHGVAVDDALAARWLGEAIARGHLPAVRDLGLLLWSGGERALARRVLRHAARGGDVFARHALARCALTSQGELDPASAHWLELAAAAGLPVSQGLLGRQAGPGAAGPLPETEQAEGDAQAIAAGMAVFRWPAARPASLPAREQRARIVWVQPDLLDALQCDYLMTAAAPWLDRSCTNDPATGRPVPDTARTSSGMNFGQAFPDLVVCDAERRIAACAGLPLSHAEPLAVLRYEVGQEYKVHHDFMAPEVVANHPLYSKLGQRVATVVTYLVQPAAGGGTVFPRLDLRIEPRPGMAVHFLNTHPDGRPDEDSLHAGLPVTAGEKWVCTLWFRERETRSHTCRYGE